MDTGLLFVCQDPPAAEHLAERWAEILELAPVAERAGFTSLHVPEHHMRADGYLPQPLIACAALAARTTTALVGPTLMVAPLRHPVHLAEEAAMVDVLSGGRLVLGLGLGNFQPEYDLFSIDMGSQVIRFEECLQLLPQLWTGQPVTFGGSVSLAATSVTPRPSQNHPPVWVGAMSLSGARRAGRLGDALLLDPLHRVQDLEPIVATYRAAADEAGRSPHVVLMRWGWVEEERGSAERTWWPHVRPAVWTYIHHIPRFREGLDPGVAQSSEPELRLEHLHHDRFLVGSAAQVQEQARQWRARLGVDRLIVKLQGESGPWGTELREAIERSGSALAATSC